jgi:hypothetical protein
MGGGIFIFLCGISAKLCILYGVMLVFYRFMATFADATLKRNDISANQKNKNN